MQISVCIGNACELKGSREVIEALQKLIQKHRLEDKVKIMEVYCLSHCRRGIAARVDGEDIMNLSVSNVEEMFQEYILGKSC